MEQNNQTEKPWYKKTWVIVVGVIMLLAVIGKLSESSDKSGADKEESATSEFKEDTPKAVGVGEVLHTDYFDIVANKVNLVDRVSTGNEFADLAPEQGNLYLIINASFKNTDNESRMIDDGSVWINYNGKDYEFDKSETIMLEGWGTLLDQINPLTTKTTNIVYKIPAEIKGNAYWQPGRTSSDERILLGTI